MQHKCSALWHTMAAQGDDRYQGHGPVVPGQLDGGGPVVPGEFDGNDGSGTCNPAARRLRC